MVTVGAQEGDAHLPQLRIHVRIVNDFAREEDPAVRKLRSRLVRVFHRPLDAVAESELAGQPDRDVPGREHEVPLAQEIHQPAGVVGGKRLMHFGLEPEALPIVCRRRLRQRHGPNLAERVLTH